MSKITRVIIGENVVSKKTKYFLHTETTHTGVCSFTSWGGPIVTKFLETAMCGTGLQNQTKKAPCVIL